MFNSKGDYFTDGHLKSHLQELFARIKYIKSRFIVPMKAQDRLLNKTDSAQFLFVIRFTKKWSCCDNSHIGRKWLAIYRAYCPPMFRKSQNW